MTAPAAAWTVLEGNCLDLLPTLPDASVDALVTDPPAGIGFMGKEWDHHKGGRKAWIEWLTGILRECLRVLKPGAHALVWALPRTSHWTGTAIEEAGFEVRDRVAFLFGTGFPKSLNLSGGRGTALKPACEDWWLCRKPLAGTVAANVLAHGTGALNIDGCRIGRGDGDRTEYGVSGDEPSRQGKNTYGVFGRRPAYVPDSSGRWPANVVLDEEAARALDEMSGELQSHGGKGIRAKPSNVYGGGLVRAGDLISTQRDSGGASRFFYTAKAARSERDAGLELLPPHTAGEATDRKDGSAGLQSPRAGAGRTGGARNHHPTVKPLDLMRWLCRLITPPGGLVLDCFMGSGSTGVACLHEGFRFIGMEREPAYALLARERLSAWAEVQDNLSTIQARAVGQMPLFGGAK